MAIGYVKMALMTNIHREDVTAVNNTRIIKLQREKK